jgi:hypothetical protein
MRVSLCVYLHKLNPLAISYTLIQEIGPFLFVVYGIFYMSCWVYGRVSSWGKYGLEQDYSSLNLATIFA